MLNGKVALITGGAHGIGRVTSQVFAEAGARVLVVDVQERAGREAVEEILEQRAEALFVKADLRHEQEIANAVDVAVASFGRLDIVIHSARPRLRRLPYGESLDEWDLAMDVFLKAPALMAKFAFPALCASGGGAILNITSVNAVFVASHQPASYHVAKAGLDQLTRYLACEFGSHGIRVNAVCPGLVDLYDEGRPLTGDPVNRATAELVVPLGRASSAEEIARVARFLCSDDASYITGQVIRVDGGEMLGDHFHIGRKAYSACKTN